MPLCPEGRDGAAAPTLKDEGGGNRGARSLTEALLKRHSQADTMVNPP